jgi:hypothetical protein
LRPLLAFALIAALATPALSFAAVDEYLLAVTHDLPAGAKDALQRIDGKPRQLLAVRGYLRAGEQLQLRWSWSADEIRTYEASQEYADLLAEIALVRARFEAANPGYSLYANTTARSLDLQLQRWNSNKSVGVIADRLVQAVKRELIAYPPIRTRRRRYVLPTSCVPGGQLLQLRRSRFRACRYTGARAPLTFRSRKARGSSRQPRLRRCRRYGEPRAGQTASRRSCATRVSSVPCSRRTSHGIMSTRHACAQRTQRSSCHVETYPAAVCRDRDTGAQRLRHAELGSARRQS